MFCDEYDSFVSALTRKGYTVHSVSTRDEARELALSLIGGGSVGSGGSMSVAEIGLIEALQKNGNAIYKHSLVPPEQRTQADRDAVSADWYVCSTNAITKNGELVNTDGIGNRIGAMIWGPHKVLLIIGKNKLAEDLPAAFARVKSEACPKNARRLGLDTPCAHTGVCTDCRSKDRMCRGTTIIEFPMRHHSEFHLVLVDRELGY